MSIKEILKDIFTDDKDGKISKKAIWGSAFAFLVAAAFVLDGLHFYKVNEHLFDSMLIAATALLGLNTISRMKFTNK